MTQDQAKLIQKYLGWRGKNIVEDVEGKELQTEKKFYLGCIFYLCDKLKEIDGVVSNQGPSDVRGAE